MQIFDITVPAYSTFVVHAPGNYLKYMSGSNGGGDASIVVTPGSLGGQKVTLAPGQAFRLGSKAKTPDSWTLANYTNAAVIVGKVVVGDGQIDDSTISGTVAVVDAGFARTQINAAFLAQGFCPANASNRSCVELVNPAGSGKLVIVEGITALSTGGAYVANFGIMSGVVAGGAEITSASVSSKMAGSPIGLAKVYISNPATTPASFYGGAACAGLSGAQSAVSMQQFKEPLILPPGYGLSACTSAPNLPLQVGFEWFEQSQ
ncbi:hypothetical protein [Caballeronia sp. LZ016]|uniref:hypothetical protein n=1 Tax=Caballeronia sp. LZ016 TaxID=3038554 RepID=UPI002866FAE0|nr:hypothetical protein [Caballeronia sp. LZ016]MDR5739492.1 hypothetical protein [Caballeronia sp. LZ016]